MILICNNKDATFNYFILEKFEAGIVLSGDEIKSCRLGNMSLKEAFITVKNNEVLLKNAYIKEFENAYDGSRSTFNTRQDRKLLLHDYEISKLKKAKEQQGQTIVPLKAYIDKKYLKIEIAIAKGKKLYDKRESIKERELSRKKF